MAESTVPFPRRSKATGAAPAKSGNVDASADAPSPAPPFTRGCQPVGGYGTAMAAPVIVNPEAAANILFEWAMAQLQHVNHLGDAISCSDLHFEDDAKGVIAALVHFNKQAEAVVCAAVSAVHAEQADLRAKMKERADG